eukprot:gene1049-1421_t
MMPMLGVVISRQTEPTTIGGRNGHEGRARELASDPHVARLYLGGLPLAGSDGAAA